MRRARRARPMDASLAACVGGGAPDGGALVRVWLVPARWWTLIVGEKEQNEKNISVRRQGSGDQGAEDIQQFISQLLEMM